MVEHLMAYLIFDPEEIAEMTQKDLLVQILYRHLLTQPRLQHNLDASKLKDDALIALNAVITNLLDDPLTAPFAPPVQAIVDAYEAELPA